MLRRYSILLYGGIGIAAVAVAGLFDSAYRMERLGAAEATPYPWIGVLGTCALILVETGLVYLIVCPWTASRSWLRGWIAILILWAYSLAFLVGSSPPFWIAHFLWLFLFGFGAFALTIHSLFRRTEERS